MSYTGEGDERKGAANMPEFEDAILAWMQTNNLLLGNLARQVQHLTDTLDRFAPLLDRYEQASKAQGFRAQRKVMKNA